MDRGRSAIPPSDLTDLFAFTSPENAGRTVLAANVFPSAGVSAMFSNAINHSIVVRRMTVAGLGDAASSSRVTRSIASIVDSVSLSVDLPARSQFSAALAPFLMARDSFCCE